MSRAHPFFVACRHFDRKGIRDTDQETVSPSEVDCTVRVQR